MVLFVHLLFTACCPWIQIAQLFVSPVGGDGRPVFESYTGAYAVKITVGGKWQVGTKVHLIHIYLPHLRTVHWTALLHRNACRCTPSTGAKFSYVLPMYLQ